MRREHAPDGRVTYYLDETGGQLLPLNRPPTRSEMRFRKFRQVSMDTSTYESAVEGLVPTATEGVSFTVAARFRWRRADAEQWFAGPVGDPAAYCRHEVTRHVAAIAQQYPWDAALDAAHECTVRLTPGEIGVGHGLVVAIVAESITVRTDSTFSALSAPRDLAFSVALPTSDDLLIFQTDVQARWRFSDPARWADRPADRAEALCREELAARLGAVTSEFGYAQYDAAARALIGQFVDHPLVTRHGLVVELWEVRVAPDARLAALPLGAHTRDLTARTPSNSDRAPFLASVSYSWQLADPRRWIGHSREELEDRCDRALLRQIAALSGRCSWDDPGKAEQTVLEGLPGPSFEGEPGLHVSLRTIELGASPEALGVDTSERSAQLSCELRTATPGAQFRADVDYTWRRSDPVYWLERPDMDAAEEARTELRELLGQVSSEWAYDQPGAAEQAIRARLGAGGTTRHGITLALRSVRLAIDAAIATVDTRRQHDEFRVQLATSTAEVSYSAEITCSYQITDPASWVGNTATVPDVVRAWVRRQLEVTTRRRELRDLSTTEQELNDLLKLLPDDADRGLKVRVENVRLAVNQDRERSARTATFHYDIDDDGEVSLKIRTTATWAIVDVAAWRVQPLDDEDEAPRLLAESRILDRIRQLVLAEPADRTKASDVEEMLRSEFADNSLSLGHGIAVTISAVTVSPGTRSRMQTEIIEFDADVPSAAQGLPFRAKVAMSWRVADPAAWRAFNADDPQTLCRQIAVDEIGKVTHEYEPERQVPPFPTRTAIEAHGLEIELISVTVTASDRLTDDLVKNRRAALQAATEAREKEALARATFGQLLDDSPIPSYRARNLAADHTPLDGRDAAQGELPASRAGRQVPKQ